MTKTATALLSGVCAGVVVTLAVLHIEQSRNSISEDVIRDIDDIPKMTQASAEQHRSERYANLTGIEQILSLPTEFARSEALHVLAGRSDSGNVQYLIFETDRIADSIERVRLLSVLFFRLAETDPKTALAMSRSGNHRAMRELERTVWIAWARNDFDAALFEAKTQTTNEHQNFAAQSLYAAFGYMGNETTDRIAAEIGIGPSRSSRSRYLYQLADKSAADAIAFINSLERGIEQEEYVSWLASYLSSHDPTAALKYADLFDVASNASRFTSIVDRNVVRADPRAAIERMLASGRKPEQRGEYYRAARAIASSDLESALQYFEQARSDNDKLLLGGAIVEEMARDDPLQALRWARENDNFEMAVLEMSAIAQIAETDAQLAMAEAMKSPKPHMRSMLLSSIVQRISQDDPVEAVSYLDNIQDREQRLEISQHLLSTWLTRDAEAAIAWVSSLDRETEVHLIQQTSHQLLQHDIDTVIRFLPRLDQQSQVFLRLRIAQALASTRPTSEAQAFISQFQGQPGHDQLQGSVVSGLVRTEPLMAIQLADQIADETVRNSAYMQVIGEYARTDPGKASRVLSSISDEHTRSAAAGNLTRLWYASDPAAAERWVSDLPSGSTRDNAIVSLSSYWSNPTAEQDTLIASIQDPAKRGQARIQLIYQLARTNPTRAREMLKSADISDEQRQSVEAMISRGSTRF